MANDWIKCNNEMPTYGQPVNILLDDNKTVTSAIRYWCNVGDLSWGNSMWSTLDGDTLIGGKVIGWKPLPSPKEDNWIKCKDRAPEIGFYVLICWEGKDRVEKGYLMQNGGWNFSYAEEWGEYAPDYWQPLPKSKMELDNEK